MFNSKRRDELNAKSIAEFKAQGNAFADLVAQPAFNVFRKLLEQAVVTFIESLLKTDLTDKDNINRAIGLQIKINTYKEILETPNNFIVALNNIIEQEKKSADRKKQ